MKSFYFGAIALLISQIVSAQEPSQLDKQPVSKSTEASQKPIPNVIIRCRENLIPSDGVDTSVVIKLESWGIVATITKKAILPGEEKPFVKRTEINKLECQYSAGSFSQNGLKLDSILCQQPIVTFNRSESIHITENRQGYFGVTRSAIFKEAEGFVGIEYKDSEGKVRSYDPVGQGTFKCESNLVLK